MPTKLSLYALLFSSSLTLREQFSLRRSRHSYLQWLSQLAMSYLVKALKFQGVIETIVLACLERALTLLEHIVLEEVRLFLFFLYDFFVGLDLLVRWSLLLCCLNIFLDNLSISLQLRYLLQGYFLREVSQSMVLPLSNIDFEFQRQLTKSQITKLTISLPIRKYQSSKGQILLSDESMNEEGVQQPLLSSKHSSRSLGYEPGTATPGFFRQTQLLTFKNLLITFKNPKNIFFLIITPFILSLFLYGMQSLAAQNGQIIISDPASQPIPPFPQCWWDDCVSLEVSFVTNNPSKTFNDYPWINSVLTQVEKQTGITPLKRQTPITSFKNLEEYYGELQSRPNRTQIGLLMCGDTSENFNGDTIGTYCSSTTKNYAYYLVLKKINSMAIIFHALDEPFPIDRTAIALKLSVDKAIINYNLPQQSKVDIQLQTGRFPLTHNRYIRNYDIVTAAGALYYMIPGLFVFLFLQSEIVRQKEYKLRQGLNIFGAKHSAYWVSWFIISILYSLIVAISSFLAGLAFGFGFFNETPAYIIILFMFFPFCLAMSMLSFMISALSSTTKAANATSYAIVLLAIVVQSFTSDNNIITLLFATDASTLVQILKVFLVLYPPFSYSKIFTNITVFSGFHFVIQDRAWVAGPHPYDYDTFTKSTSGPLFTGGTFERYSDLGSMGILYADAAMFAVLAWYFDHVIASNRGRAESLLFPIHKIIGLFNKQNKNYVKQKKITIRSRPAGEEEESAVRERNRVYQNSEKNIPALGLRIKCLNKTFKGTCSKKEVNALNELTLQIQPGQLMGILGHNGAGKTTLINILTGVLSPDQLQDTEIIINQQPIVKIDEIRKFIGLCAQFDILWQQITAYQHLYLFASLKGIGPSEINDSILSLLQMVGLSKEIHNKVGGFSGGMKRRLSLAMAAIGNPKIILLDQPTTGLDPKVRQQVWSLIGKLKAHRSIILTTHSMEEADVLADRVCVMVKGRVKCVGSSIVLKELYGNGHRLTLNIDKGSYEKVTKTLKKICPTSQILDFKGGNIVVGIEQFDSLIRLVKIFESNQPQGLEEYQLKNAIRDWAVSHATLQQVFMAVSKQHQH